MTRYRFLIGAMGLVVLGALLEQRAAVCGAGLLATRLPYRLLGQSYNGQFWVGDAEGWGVVWPPGALHLMDGRTIESDRIEAYDATRGLRLLVRTAAGELVVMEVVKDGSSFGLTLDDPDRSGKDRAIQEKGNWTYVGYERCLGGHSDHLRMVLLAGLLWLSFPLISAWLRRLRTQRNPSD